MKMLLHRFKIEAREQKLVLISWGAALILFSILLNMAWRDINETEYATFANLMLVLLAAIPAIAAFMIFKKDDIKEPRAFWNTKPIRPLILHGGKLFFMFITFILPLALVTFVCALQIEPLSVRTFIYVIEASCWISGIILFISSSAVLYAGYAKPLLFLMLGFVSFLATVILINYFEQHASYSETELYGKFELLILLALVLILGLVVHLKTYRKVQFSCNIFVIAILGSLVGYSGTCYPLMNLIAQKANTVSKESVEYSNTTLRNTGMSGSGVNGVDYEILHYHTNVKIESGKVKIPGGTVYQDLELDEPTLSKAVDINVVLSRPFEPEEESREFPITVSITARYLESELPPYDRGSDGIEFKGELKKVRLHGVVHFLNLEKEEFHRSKMNQSFICHHDGARFVYEPKGFVDYEKEYFYDDICHLTSMRKKLPLLFNGKQTLYNVDLFIYHPSSKLWLVGNRGSGSSSNSGLLYESDADYNLFGNVNKETLLENFGVRSLKQLNEEAEVVLFETKELGMISIPIDVVLELPVPVKN